jgi:hypothetical protein
MFSEANKCLRRKVSFKHLYPHLPVSNSHNVIYKNTSAPYGC